jgi:hypothetical protein
MDNEGKWNTLIGKIKDGKCTPFLGAGTAHGILPLGAELSEEILAEEEASSGPSPLTDRKDLARASQYIAVKREDSSWPKTRACENLRRRGTPDLDDPDEPHTVFAQLNLPVYLTTNYDNFMHMALQRKHPNAKQEFARWTSSLLEDHPSAFDSGFNPDKDNPVVFHLHGHWGLPESLVMTEDDYLDYLVNVSRDLGNSPANSAQRTILPLRIRRALTNSTLLFLGYSLNDINFRVILRGLVSALPLSARQFNLAVQFSDGKCKEMEEYLVDYFGWTLQLSVFFGDASGFCAELRRRMGGP